MASEVDLMGVEPTLLTCQQWRATVTLRAQIHTLIIKQKEPLFKDSLC